MRFLSQVLVTSLLIPEVSGAQSIPVLPDSIITAIAQELSGVTAKRNLEFISREHRTRGSRPWHTAGAFVMQQARAYGLADAHIEEFPADGKVFYGTQRSRPPWDAEFAELWLLRRDASEWVRDRRLASWDAMPITLAQDSESGDATADVVDVGNGTDPRDYAGKDVRGKLVLAAQQPGPVAELAVARFGAAGIISYAQNQRTAWWGEDETLVRWGHLDAFAGTPTFAFMISLKEARELKDRLARGEAVRMHASVRAGKHNGNIEVVTATIPGTDPQLASEEIAYSCHLDHPRPGANDNASGCVTILEVARTLQALIASKRIPPPARTIRFIWPPEIEGTHALLNARPQITSRLKAVIHLDMVGGDPAITKSIFHVTRGPASLPSFIYDVAASFGELVNRESDAFASSGNARWPLVSPEGGKEALQASIGDFSRGSDHEIYIDASWGIPAFYMNDWPDRYIHTDKDVAANIDPTKLTRAAFIAAASGYVMANARPGDAAAIWDVVRPATVRRTGMMFERRRSLDPVEAAILTRHHFATERAIVSSMNRFFALPADVQGAAETFIAALEQTAGPLAAAVPPASPGGRIVYRRNPSVKGPLSAMGYDYLADKAGVQKASALRLPAYRGAHGTGDLYAYETLNFVDGKRSVTEIRDAVSAQFGPVPLHLIVEYLAALESIGLVQRATTSTE
jgi:aminopeptidase YwaD